MNYHQSLWTEQKATPELPIWIYTDGSGIARDNLEKFGLCGSLIGSLFTP